jgi:hypothetical protein
MNNYNKACLVRTSNNEYYSFFIADGLLIVQSFINNKFSSPLIIRQDVEDYCLAIDENDLIHIACFCPKKLIYFTYPNQINSQVIIYRGTVSQLHIKILDASVNILYVVENAATSFLYHSFIASSHWHHIQLEKLETIKYLKPFYIDSWQNELYILLHKNPSIKEYELLSFNLNNKNWTILESISLNLSNINSLSFFITPKEIALITFNQIIDKNLQVFMKYKKLKDSGGHWSQPINISSNNINAQKPFCLFKENFFYIAWFQEESICYKTSKDLLNWSKENTAPIAPSPFSYLSNHQKDIFYKSSLAPYVFFQSEEQEKLFSSIINNMFSSIKIITTQLTENNTKNLETEMIKTSTSDYTDDKTNTSYALEVLQKQNDYLNEIIGSLKKQISMLQSEKNTNLLNSDKKIKALLKILEEKNKIINELHRLR